MGLAPLALADATPAGLPWLSISFRHQVCWLRRFGCRACWAGPRRSERMPVSLPQLARMTAMVAW